MKRITTAVLATTAAIFMTACGGGGSSSDNVSSTPTPPSSSVPPSSDVPKTPQMIALNKIKAYAADNTQHVPTVQDYLNAGVLGITTENIDDVNEVVAGLTPNDVDTPEEIQKIVNDLGINIIPSANAGHDRTVGVNRAVTITGSGTDIDGTIVSYEWSKGTAVLATRASFNYLPTVVGIDTLTLTVTDDDGATASDSVMITVNPVSPGSSQIKKTGQINSYNIIGKEVIDGSIKDDGYYQAGITPSYTRNNGIVEDHVTGLEWQDDYSNNNGNIKFSTWSEAVSYCSSLPLDGGGWRLPTIVELYGIVVDSAYNPGIDTIAFSNNDTSSNSNGSFWSSTDSVGYINGAVVWLVDFYNGYIHGDGKLRSNHVRCVRVRR